MMKVFLVVMIMMMLKTMIGSNYLNSAVDVSFQSIQPLRVFDFVIPYNFESISSCYSWYFTFRAAIYQTIMSSFPMDVLDFVFP